MITILIKGQASTHLHKAHCKCCDTFFAWEADDTEVKKGCGGRCGVRRIVRCPGCQGEVVVG